MHIRFGVGNGLGADVLGAGPDRGAAFLDRTRGRLCRAHEFLERLAGLVDARLGHRSHLLGNLETVSHFFIHGSSPVAFLAGPSTAPMPGSPTSNPTDKTTHRNDAAPTVPHRGFLTGFATFQRGRRRESSGQFTGAGRIKVIAASDNSVLSSGGPALSPLQY